MTDARPVASPSTDPAPAPDTTSSRRRELVDGHLKLVYKLAIQAYRAIRGAIELDDLIGFGTEGLLQAADRFDPTRGYAFTTFAYRRIHGAIYDGIRQLAPLPTTLYRRTRGDRRPDPAKRKDHEAPAPFVTSLDAYIAAGYQFATPERNAEQNAGAHQLRGLMASAVERLSGRERALIQAHYYDDESLQGIGRQFGVSRSWACRLHARAIDHLRDSMAAPSLAA